MAALDGIRALALIAVVLFHSKFGWAQGGFLGVTAFFVLSGFLITGLLLRERDATGTIGLRAFWERRARRLAPALVVLLVLVIAYVAYGATRVPHGVVGDAIASSTWVANWRFVFADRSYAALFSTPSPFAHMWSLAVEEQVYLVLPVVVLLLLGRKATTPRRGRLALVLFVIAAASTLAAALLHRSGAAPLHEYYGTDARAAEPVIGALLALALVRPRGLLRLVPRARALLDACAVGAIGGLALLVARLGQNDDALYRGGFLLAAVLSAIVVAAATQREGLVARVLAFAPLAALGRVSYGAYLFHWPIFLWLSPARTGLDGAQLLGVRSACTLALTAASYRLFEMPVRAGRIPTRLAVPGWANASVGLVATLVLVTMTVSSAAPASTLFAGRIQPPPPPPVVAAPTTVAPSVTASSPTLKSASAAGAAPVVRRGPASPAPTAPAPPRRTNNELSAGPPPAPQAPPPTAGPGSPKLRVAVIGDSMSMDLAQGLTEWANERGDVVVYGLGLPGCPLSRGGTRRMPGGEEWTIDRECGWWANTSGERYKNFVAFAPHVVVMHDGINEIADRKIAEWPTYRRPGDLGFDRWLQGEYRTAITTFTEQGGKVLALNAVCADWDTLSGGFEEYGRSGDNDGDSRIAALGNVNRSLASARVEPVDFQARLCPKGRYTTTVEGVRDARPDGYHLSPAAGRALSDKWLGPLVLEAGAPYRAGS